MTDVTVPDLHHPRRSIRLDTILRLRWLAALGQLAAIFFVVQSLDFDLPVIPCVAIIAVSAVVTLALQMAFNPMRRLEPRFAAALLALNIALFSMMMPVLAITTTWAAFVAVRCVVNFALNGEWSLGSMLVAETWPARETMRIAPARSVTSMRPCGRKAMLQGWERPAAMGWTRYRAGWRGKGALVWSRRTGCWPGA